MADPNAKTAACPICDKPADRRYRPFCSKRCADVDLARWLGGTYRIPTDDVGAPEAGEDLPGTAESLEKND